MGPPGPTGETDTLYVSLDPREIVWLYPEDVIYQDSVDYGGSRFERVYFDISGEEYYERKGTNPVFFISSFSYQYQDTIKYWSTAYAEMVNDPISIYHKKLRMRLYHWIDWYYAYFYWDAETP